MNKLVKLLNEYHFSGTEYIGYYLDEEENKIYFRTKVIDKGLVDEQQISDERIISKRFGFIKWLVDNDKIDQDKLEKKVLKEDLIRKFDEGLIMLLSISDHPIEDLCKLLK